MSPKRRIEKQTGTSVVLPKGTILRLIDPFGEQVSDVYAVENGDPTHVLSSGRSLDYAERIWLTEGDILYSNRSVPMLRIGQDTVRRHDFLLTPCSQETFDLLYPDWEGYHPSCYENLCKALAPHGVKPDHIGTTFNAFMNVVVTAEGKLDIQPPLSRPGDLIELHAEMDLVVGLTACSAEMSNNGTLKPIDFEVL
ncbi:MAG TPA: urea carboxylase-associated family protein [Candidatus Limnocylindrales bacterium]|nr:urea carboxylase-associated family protein [Candidatus Limnocylindrales bacterium]